MSPDLPDVDALMTMAKEEPERLELLRRSFMAALIDSAPNESIKNRLRGLQFRVELQREREGTPVAECFSLTQMIRESLAELSDALVDPEAAPITGTADVFEFPNKS